MEAKYNVIAEIVNDYSKVKNQIKVRLYGKEKEADVQRSAEEYGFADLILVPYIEDVIENGSIRVDKNLIEKWGVTEDEVFAKGIDNIDYTIMSLSEMLFGAKFDDDPMQIITNKNTMFGASAIIKAKKELDTKFPNGYVVLPSSVHEVLAVPIGVNGNETADLLETVKMINADVVAPEDKLSDNAYEFVA